MLFNVRFRHKQTTFDLDFEGKNHISVLEKDEFENRDESILATFVTFWTLK